MSGTGRVEAKVDLYRLLETGRKSRGPVRTLHRLLRGEQMFIVL